MIRMTALGGALLLVVGCGPTVPKDKVAKAEAALKTALEAWKKGDKPETLASASPPINLYDDLWKKGYQLVDFQLVKTITNKGEICVVTKLNVKDRQGKTTDWEVGYAIVVDSTISISRDPFF